MTTVGSRINDLLRELDTSILQFSKIVGVSNKMVGGYISGKNPVSGRVINFICSAYPDLNREWLEKGKGAIWKNGKTVSDIKVMPASTGRRTITSAVPPPRKDEKPKTQELSNGDVICPYYDVDFACGFPFFENDQTEYPARFIVSPVNRKDLTVWCNATGSSMEPTIMPGDAVALEKVVERTQVIYGEIYAIVTNSYRTIKRVCAGSDKKKWLLLSDNPDKRVYADQEIEISEVIQIYRVTGSMHRF